MYAMILANLYFCILTAAVAGEVAVGSDVIDLGNRLGNLSASGVLGVIAIVSLFLLRKLYVDRNKDIELTRAIASQAVAAIEKNVAKTEDQIKLLEAMHNDISLCRKLNTEKMGKAQSENNLKTFGGG